MQHLEAKDLLKKYRQGKATQDEANRLLHWVQGYDISGGKIFSEEELENVKTQMWKYLTEDQFVAKKVNLWPRITVVAAALTVIIFGVWIYTYHPVISLNAENVNQNDIDPGKFGATLTLASGKQIRLTNARNGKIADEAGLRITKSADGRLVYEIKDAESGPNQINTLSTAKGETYQVRLPDGSIVYLNAASSLTYGTSLISRGGMRRVKLSGEGYFEVTKDKSHPFIVESRGQQVEVLGTHFNINSYTDEPVVKTTLLRGNVKVKASGTENKMEKVLKPSQQSILYNDRIKIARVDTQEVTAWKNGLFVFNDEPIADIMRRVSRWYDIKVVYLDVDQKELFGGGISRYENISKVLTKLEKTGGVHFKLDGKTLYTYQNDPEIYKRLINKLINQMPENEMKHPNN